MLQVRVTTCKIKQDSYGHPVATKEIESVIDGTLLSITGMGNHIWYVIAENGGSIVEVKRETWRTIQVLE